MAAVPSRHEGAELIQACLGKINRGHRLLPPPTLMMRVDEERVVIEQSGMGEIEQFEGRVIGERAIERINPGGVPLQVAWCENWKAEHFSHGI